MNTEEALNDYNNLLEIKNSYQNQYRKMCCELYKLIGKRFFDKDDNKVYEIACMLHRELDMKDCVLLKKVNKNGKIGFCQKINFFFCNHDYELTKFYKKFLDNKIIFEDKQK